MSNFSRKKRNDGLTSFYGCDKLPKPDRDDVTDQIRTEVKKKNKVHTLSREWSEENGVKCLHLRNGFRVFRSPYSAILFSEVIHLWPSPLCNFYTNNLKYSNWFFNDNAKVLLTILKRRRRE